MQTGLSWPKNAGPLKDWDEHTLVKGRYTAASDTYQLGKLMQALLAGLQDCSAQAWQCAQAIASIETEQRLSAEAIFGHAWLSAVAQQ